VFVSGELSNQNRWDMKMAWNQCTHCHVYNQPNYHFSVSTTGWGLCSHKTPSVATYIADGRLCQTRRVVLCFEISVVHTSHLP
jgi:hypothetical protein